MADDLDFELAESELFEAESPLARGGGGLVMPLGKAPPPGLPSSATGVKMSMGSHASSAAAISAPPVKRARRGAPMA